MQIVAAWHKLDRHIAHMPLRAEILQLFCKARRRIAIAREGQIQTAASLNGRFRPLQSGTGKRGCHQTRMSGPAGVKGFDR